MTVPPVALEPILDDFRKCVVGACGQPATAVLSILGFGMAKICGACRLRLLSDLAQASSDAEIGLTFWSVQNDIPPGCLVFALDASVGFGWNKPDGVLDSDAKPYLIEIDDLADYTHDAHWVKIVRRL